MCVSLDVLSIFYKLSNVRVILGCDFPTPSSLMFTENEWLTFPQRVAKQPEVVDMYV